MKDNREELKNKDAQETENLSLNDDRRVKVLSTYEMFEILIFLNRMY